MAVYNVDKIDNWYNDFVALKNKFSNTYYSNYKSSYVRSCYDSAVNKMESNLNKHYLKIEKLYNNINNVWREYLTDLKNVDKRLAGGKGSINAGIVSSKLSKLPVLKEYKRDLSIRIKSVSGVVGTAKVVGWAEDRSIKENFGYVFGDALEKTGATIATAAVSLVEGVAKLGEDFVDLFAFASAGIATVFTYADPNSSYEEKKQMVESIWEDTRSFVSVNYVQSAFDSFYEKTAAGNWMEQNAYGFDTVREIGTEIGEVVGVVALSAITGGSAAVMYGAAKTAEHTEENWQDENTSTFKGLAKGALQGIGDGIFFSIGMKGDKIAQTAAKKAVESGGKTFLKKSAILGAKMMFEGGTSVAQDSSSILLDTLFSDNKIVDQNGQVITFTNFSDKWEYYYEQAGGTQALVQSMGTAAVLSFFSDRSDIYGIKNSSSAMKNADVDLNADQIGKSTRDINIKNMNSNSKVYSDVEISGLKKEYDDLINWRSSDKFLTDEAYYQAHGDKIGGNPYKKNMDRIAELEEILANNNDSFNKSLDSLDEVIASNNKSSKFNQISSEGKDIADYYKREFIEEFKSGRDVLGGNQESCLNKFKKVFKSSSDKLEIKNLEDTVHKYYPDMSKHDMEKLFSKINSTGCTYVATANSIYEQFNYNADLFRKKFGFDMYLPNGELNNNQLILDMYLFMEKRLQINYKGSYETITYDSWTAAAKSIFGEDLPQNEATSKVVMEASKLGWSTEGCGGNLDGTVTLKKYNMQPKTLVGTPEELVYKLTGKKMNIDSKDLSKFLKDNQIVANIENTHPGSKIFRDDEWLQSYFKSKGVNLEEHVKYSHLNLSNDSSSLFSDLKRAYDEGYSISVVSPNKVVTSLSNGSKFGHVMLDGVDSGHAMIFRGVTKEGNLIVSSWGKYFLIEKEFVPNLDFHFIKIGVGD